MLSDFLPTLILLSLSILFYATPKIKAYIPSKLTSKPLHELTEIVTISKNSVLVTGCTFLILVAIVINLSVQNSILNQEAIEVSVENTEFEYENTMLKADVEYSSQNNLALLEENYELHEAINYYETWTGIITSTGSCYHKYGCKYTAYSKYLLPKEVLKKNGFIPCSICHFEE